MLSQSIAGSVTPPTSSLGPSAESEPQPNLAEHPSGFYRRWQCINPTCRRITNDASEAALPCECEQLIDGREAVCGARFAPVALYCAAGQHAVFALAMESSQHGSCCPACMDDVAEPVTVRVVSMFDLVFAEAAGMTGSR